MLDLRVDSRDRALDIPYHHGPQPMIECAPQVVRTAVTQADTFWNEYRTTGRLRDAFIWLRQYYATHEGLGFYNFVQHPLALAFVYAMAGDLEEAYRELEEYGPSLDFADVGEALRQRLAAAAGAP